MVRSRTPNPPAPLVPFVHTKGPQAYLGRQHCSCTLLANTESTVKLQATIQNATDVGAVGSEYYAKAGVAGRAKHNLARGSNI